MWRWFAGLANCNCANLHPVVRSTARTRTPAHVYAGYFPRAFLRLFARGHARRDCVRLIIINNRPSGAARFRAPAEHHRHSSGSYLDVEPSDNDKAMRERRRERERFLVAASHVLFVVDFARALISGRRRESRFSTGQVAVQPPGNKWEGAKPGLISAPGASTRRELFEQTITLR